MCGALPWPLLAGVSAHFPVGIPTRIHQQLARKRNTEAGGSDCECRLLNLRRRTHRHLRNASSNAAMASLCVLSFDVTAAYVPKVHAHEALGSAPFWSDSSSGEVPLGTFCRDDVMSTSKPLVGQLRAPGSAMEPVFSESSPAPHAWAAHNAFSNPTHGHLGVASTLAQSNVTFQTRSSSSTSTSGDGAVNNLRSQRRRGGLSGFCERICGVSTAKLTVYYESEFGEQRPRGSLKTSAGGSRGVHLEKVDKGFGTNLSSKSTQRRVTLVMSGDNVVALSVIFVLSLLGAIYLWKICTRKSCVCRLCRNHYRTLNLLGSGGYGSVYLVERSDTGVCFVSKKIPVREITEVDQYSREAKDLVQLRHKHIVSYEEDFVHVEYGALEPKTFFIIIMEYCPEGDLKEKIEKDFGNFTEEWVGTVFAQLLQAVQYLHSKNVIHRDLKSQNVFLAEDGLVRLGDFGLCRKASVAAAAPSAALTHAGTDCYMAPEMLSSSRYGKPADMWSLGCVLYELCTGQFMWELDGILGAMVMKEPNVVRKLLQINLAPSVGKSLSTLIRRLLCIDQALRPTATSCIRKKLFKRTAILSRQPFGELLQKSDDDSNEKDSGGVSDTSLCSDPTHRGETNSSGFDDPTPLSRARLVENRACSANSDNGDDQDDEDANAKEESLARRPKVRHQRRRRGCRR